MALSNLQLGQQEANAVAAQFGLPPLPSPDQIQGQLADAFTSEFGLTVPSDLTPEGILAWAGGLSLDLPFPLPTSFPSSVSEAIEEGLLYGAQLFGPQVLTAVGLGSIVPGVGWIVSAGTIIVKLIGSYLVMPPDLSRYFCWPTHPGPGVAAGAQTFMGQFPEEVWGGKFPYPHARGEGVNASPMLLFVWAQASLSRATAVNLDPSRAADYHESTLLQCITNNEQLIRHRLFNAVSTSIDQATAAEAMGVLSMFAYIQNEYPQIPFEPHSIEVVNRLAARATYLQNLVGEFNQVVQRSRQSSSYNLQTHIADTMAVTVKVIDEMRTAAMAVQRSQQMPYWSRLNLEQFAIAASMYAQLDALKLELIAESQVGAPVLTAEEEMERWLTEEAGGQWQPTRVQPPAPSMTQAELSTAQRQQCEQNAAAWAQHNPKSAKCLSAADTEQMITWCGLTQSGAMTPQAMSNSIDQLVAVRCEARGKRTKAVAAVALVAAGSALLSFLV